jgi:hypothetical protein
MLPLAIMLAVLGTATAEETSSPFSQRGYYLTLMRMPTFDLDDWKQIVDCTRDDGGNTLILWVAGGFRSKKFPETWEHNTEHENIRKDFVRELIDYAHSRGIKVLLGFTPFGYDGANRMSLHHPDWTATGPDGKPTRKFGIHCWGYNLCPSRKDVHQFMLDYVREMAFDFYPNADGLLIESSDYAACHCKNCGSHYFDHEFRFVKAISEEVWAKNPDATVIVYPHYFSGAKDVPAVNLSAARQPFDPRWTLFYTPHSAHPDAALTAKARGAIWSDDGPALRTPSRIRDGARRAREAGCSGYVPSLEAFSYVTTEPEEGQPYLVGTRQKPFGLGWLKDGEMPFNELPVRVNRTAYREFSRNPEMSDGEFCVVLGKTLFGERATPEAIDDALALEELVMSQRTWSQAAPLANPERVRSLVAAGSLSAEVRSRLRADLKHVREIEGRSRGKGEPLDDLHSVAEWVSDQWRGENEKLLAP